MSRGGGYTSWQPEVVGEVSWDDVDVVHHHDYRRLRDMTEALDALTVQSLHNHDFSCSSRTRYWRTATPCLKPHGASGIGNWPKCAHSPQIDALFMDYKTTTLKLSLTKSSDFGRAYSQYMRRIAEISGIEGSRIRVILACPQ